MYSRGVSPRIPLNPMMSPHLCGIYLHSLILISQSVPSLSLGHTPHGVHKPQDTPHSLHPDSDQQKDNFNCTQPLASSMFTSDHSLHQRVLARLRHSLQLHAPSTILCLWHYQHVIIHFQGRFLHLQCMLSGRFCTAHS